MYLCNLTQLRCVMQALILSSWHTSLYSVYDEQSAKELSKTVDMSPSGSVQIGLVYSGPPLQDPAKSLQGRRACVMERSTNLCD